MAAKSFKALDGWVPADVLQISIKLEGIQRLRYLIFLANFGHLYISAAERERIDMVLQADSWLWDANRVIEVTLTDSFERAPFEKAVEGFMDKPLTRSLAETGTPGGQAKKAVTPRKNPRIAEPVDLQKIWDILEFGITCRELADALDVNIQSVHKWKRNKGSSPRQILSQTAGLSKTLDVLHAILFTLSQQGLSKESITRWWRIYHPEFDASPSQVFRESKAKQEVVLQAAEQYTREVCAV